MPYLDGVDKWRPALCLSQAIWTTKLGTTASGFNGMVDNESPEDILDLRVFDNGRSPAIQA